MGRYGRRWLASLILGWSLVGCTNPLAGPRFEPVGPTDRVALSLVVHRTGAILLGTSNGLLHSLDSGQSWQATRGIPADTTVPSLTQVASHTYAATSRGVYVSLDGLSWEALGAGLPTDAPVLSVARHPLIERILVVGTGRHGLYRSDDAGQSWRPASTGLPKPDLPVYLVTPDPNQTGRLANRWWAGTIGFGLYRSDDEAVTWQPVSAGLSPNISVFSLIGDSEGSLVLGTSVGLFRSSDGGATWRWSRAVLGQTRVVALTRELGPNGRLLAGADDGVYRSTDRGASWQRLAEGLPADEHVGAVAIAGSWVLATAGQVWRLKQP